VTKIICKDKAKIGLILEDRLYKSNKKSHILRGSINKNRCSSFPNQKYNQLLIV